MDSQRINTRACSRPFARISCLSFTLICFIIAGALSSCEQSMSTKAEQFPVYEGRDLGLSFSGDEMQLRTWAPTADAVRLRLYTGDDPQLSPEHELDMELGDSGTWYTKLSSSHRGMYYSLSAKVDGAWRPEVPGPYAKAVGTNGLRGQLINPSEAMPPDWEEDSHVAIPRRDIVVYELHVRDFSIHPASGMEHKGKYLAFTERGTRSPQGLATGVDHLLELGITHVHLLPVFDFLSIDESRLGEPQYNWGYDPQNFNVPEGSYSSDPSQASVRIREFKSMVKALHEAGIGVIMDVVYNHTGKVEGLSFDALVPGYYYRYNKDGELSNASGCGNEMASEKPMMRKFMIESLEYWMQEYHIDGFRFDLMGIHDIETMNAIEKRLRELNPHVFLYGEGWTADTSPLPVKKRALKGNMKGMPGIAAFSDDLRDGLKGSWAEHTEKGFVSGNESYVESVKFGMVAGVEHPEIDYEDVNHSKEAWALQPEQFMAYVSCHDNHTLYDRLKLANPDATKEELQKMHIMAHAAVLCSQGQSFLHAGSEFMRSKQGVENSYKSPDSINQIDWTSKAEAQEVLEAFKQLIAMRKEQPLFRLPDAGSIAKSIQFTHGEDGILAYTIEAANEGRWNACWIVLNSAAKSQKINTPEGPWRLYWQDGLTDTKDELGKVFIAPARSVSIAYR